MLATTLWVIYMIWFKLESSYMKEKDNFGIYYVVFPCAILAFAVHPSTTHNLKHQEGIGLVDKHGLPLSEWSTDVNLSSDEMSQFAKVMESLIKRAIKAETEAATEKEKVKLGLEENKRKTLQIQDMTLKVEEMEKFALGTNTLLNEMRQKVADMVEETSRQRQRAAENEQELHRVKQDFDSLRSFVSSLIRVRESLMSSERQFQTVGKLLDSASGWHSTVLAFNFPYATMKFQSEHNDGSGKFRCNF
ncbi:hypothetical protein OPV22_008701 [Ensete ventricosum]|uniref:Uncharacterized protein n=1 Tax=Ensete ventricosum TaxID=4639 RepID=A0AAV8RFC8_ENSVE|nr:hypothetical protein OPV22_008701 [Ensete ventricosum]